MLLWRRVCLRQQSSRLINTIPSCFEFSEEVSDGLKLGKPIVALESTVITHGLKFPNNFETGKLLEKEIRKKSVIPATIALINGKIKIGLNNTELKFISEPGNKSVKTSTRDLANVLERKIIGGTTVAATMRIAHMAGIRIFATGGIGGVHRGADQTFDISADLTELGRTPVTVVCAGAKSILDVPKTLEFLETQSCNVIVYGNEPYFPGFFTKKTKEKVSFWTEDLSEISRILLKQDEIGLNIGTLIACPPPSDEGEKIEKIIQKAVEECREKGIASKDVTPFILARINELSSGKSMEINIALLKNNAEIAANLAKLYSEAKSRKSVFTASIPTPTVSKPKPKVLSVGAAIVDLEVITNENVKDDGGSYKGKIIQRCGGVGRNHAEALGKLGCESTFLTAVGDDEISQFLFRNAKNYDLSHAKIVKSVPTATYLSVNVKGTVVHGFSAIEDIVANITPEYIKQKENLFENKDFIVIDGNLTVEAMDTVISLANQHRVKIWFDPTDIAKATKILYNENYKKINVISPNFNEMMEYIKAFNYDSKLLELDLNLLLKSPMMELVEEFLLKMNSEDAQFFVTLGPVGILAFEKTASGVKHKVLPSPVNPKSEEVVSVSGAGDSFNSGFLAAKLYGRSFEDSINAGIACARESLLHVEAVPESLNPNLIGIN